MGNRGYQPQSPRLKGEIERKKQVREKYEKIVMGETVKRVVSGLLRMKTLDRNTQVRVRRYIENYPEDIDRWQQQKVYS